MNIISWLILGAIAGYLAGFLVKGDEGLGVIGHIVLGIVGRPRRWVPRQRDLRHQADRWRVQEHQLDRGGDDWRGPDRSRRGTVTGRSRSGRGAI